MTHLFKPVRLICRARLRIHARHRSPTTEHAKAAEMSHFTEEEVSNRIPTCMQSWSRLTWSPVQFSKVGCLALDVLVRC